MGQWAAWRSPRYDGLAVGQAQAIRRMSGAMARGAALVGVGVSVLCVGVATVVQGVPGFYGSGLGALLATGSALLTPVLMLRTTTLEPAVVMLASFVGLTTKAIVLLAVLFTLGNVAGLHRMSLALTMLVVLIATTAAEAHAGSRIKILIGSDPGPPSA